VTKGKMSGWLRRQDHLESVKRFGVTWPEVSILVLGTFGYLLAQVVATIGTERKGSSRLFVQTAQFHVFRSVLGFGYFLCFAIMPIAWHASNSVRGLVGRNSRFSGVIVSVVSITAATLALPFLPGVPSLPQIAVAQHWRTDFTTLLTFAAIIIPSSLAIFTVRQFAQSDAKFHSVGELVDVVSKFRKYLRFFLIIQGIAIAIGVLVFSSLRSAVEHNLNLLNPPSSLTVANFFPAQYLLLYGAAFSLMFAIIYGPTEAQLTLFANREFARLSPIDWSEEGFSQESALYRNEVTRMLDLSSGQRYERWLAILAPLIAAAIASVGKL